MAERISQGRLLLARARPKTQTDQSGQHNLRDSTNGPFPIELGEPFLYGGWASFDRLLDSFFEFRIR